MSERRVDVKKGSLKKWNPISRRWIDYYVSIRGEKLYIFKSERSRSAEDLMDVLVLSSSGKLTKGKEKYDFIVQCQNYQGNESQVAFRSKRATDFNEWMASVYLLVNAQMPSRADCEVSRSFYNHLQQCANTLREQQTSSGAAATPAEASTGWSGRHPFYTDSNNRTTPSWFFERCDRQLSERLLIRGQQYGNLLMRESSSFSSTGIYTISILADPAGDVRHYEVVPTDHGYKVRLGQETPVERCLDMAMRYFVSITGGRPMCINDVAAVLAAQRPAAGLSRYGSVGAGDDWNAVVEGSFGFLGNSPENSARAPPSFAQPPQHYPPPPPAPPTPLNPALSNPSFAPTPQRAANHPAWTNPTLPRSASMSGVVPAHFEQPFHYPHSDYPHQDYPAEEDHFEQYSNLDASGSIRGRPAPPPVAGYPESHPASNGWGSGGVQPPAPPPPPSSGRAPARDFLSELKMRRPVVN